MKKMIYINEENFKVEVLVKEVKNGEVMYKFIENEEEGEWMNGWMNEGELYHSKEEYYYDNKNPMVKF